MPQRAGEQCAQHKQVGNFREPGRAHAKVGVDGGGQCVRVLLDQALDAQQAVAAQCQGNLGLVAAGPALCVKQAQQGVGGREMAGRYVFGTEGHPAMIGAAFTQL